MAFMTENLNLTELIHLDHLERVSNLEAQNLISNTHENSIVLTRRNLTWVKTESKVLVRDLKGHMVKDLQVGIHNLGLLYSRHQGLLRSQDQAHIGNLVLSLKRIGFQT